MRTLIQFKHRFLGFRHLDLQSAACLARLDLQSAACLAGLTGEDDGVAGAAAGEQERLETDDDPDPDPDLAPLPPSAHAPLRLARADPADPVATPFWTAQFPDEATAAAVVGRASLVKCVLDLWGEGADLDSLATSLATRGAAAKAAALGGGPGLTWRATVDCWGSALPGGGGHALIPALLARLGPALAAMPGRVRLSRPDVELRLVIVAPGGRLPGGVGEVARAAGWDGGAGADGHTSPAASPATHARLYFGRAIAPHAIDARKHALAARSLATRPFAGPTAMDPGVAAVMCCAGLVGAGCLAYDPFAGSGSILVSAAGEGAHVLGGELDAFALAGRPAARAAADRRRAAAAGPSGKASHPPRPPPPATPLPADALSRSARRKLSGASARACAYERGAAGSAAAAEAAREGAWGASENFSHYALPRPAGLLLADASSPPFRHVPGGWLDAVIADPPYGVRAGGRRVCCGGAGGGAGGGWGEEAPAALANTGAAAAAAAAAPPRGPSRAAARFRVGGAPVPTAPYPLGDLVWDLLRFAAAALVDGGRLVFFLPSRAGPLDAASLPSHPALELVAAPGQPLNSWYCRRLVVMSRKARVRGGEVAEAEAEAAHVRGGGNAAAFAAADAVAAGVGDGEEEAGEGAGGEAGAAAARAKVLKGRGKQV